MDQKNQQQTHQIFALLHQQKTPLVLLNSWDAASSALAAALGAKAIATSSASLSWALGYQDGNQLPFAELKSAIERINKVVDLPLTVDLENGYSLEPGEVAKQVVELVDMGVVGINIEDGDDTAETLVMKIDAIRTALKGKPLFINARTDVFLRELVTAEQRVGVCLDRADQYVSAGADGIFIPGIDDHKQIKQLSEELWVPLNVMISGDQINIEALQAAGVARISTGPAPFLATYSTLLDYAAQMGWGSQLTQLSYANCDAMFA